MCFITIIRPCCYCVCFLISFFSTFCTFFPMICCIILLYPIMLTICCWFCCPTIFTVVSFIFMVFCHFISTFCTCSTMCFISIICPCCYCMCFLISCFSTLCAFFPMVYCIIICCPIMFTCLHWATFCTFVVWSIIMIFCNIFITFRTCSAMFSISIICPCCYSMIFACLIICICTTSKATFIIWSMCCWCYIFIFYCCSFWMIFIFISTCYTCSIISMCCSTMWTCCSTNCTCSCCTIPIMRTNCSTVITYSIGPIMHCSICIVARSTISYMVNLVLLLPITICTVLLSCSVTCSTNHFAIMFMIININIFVF